MSNAVQVELGAVVSLWRYPVKSMMGEELNATQVTERGLLGDLRPWLGCCAVFLLSLVTAAGLGCGTTVSYKFGGTPSDQQTARDRCHTEVRSEGPDFERCMAEQGWTVTQLGASAGPSDAKERVRAKSASTRSQSLSAAGSVAPSSELSNAPSAVDPIVVKGWFKFGGTRDDLDAATQRCVAKLGIAHRPEPPPHAVSHEMLDCLRTEGWRAVESQ